MKRIERLLKDKIGLDSGSIGSTLIERSVRLRAKNLGLQSIEEYERLVESSEPEWNELVESVVVTETWFFRDRAPFAAVGRLARDQWLPAHPRGAMRLLSVPCSSGEEPYSLVMALLDAGVSPDRFHIDASDISPRALARAQLGVYGKNSFRGKDLAYRARYFQQTSAGFVLSPAVRSSVHFHQANLFGNDFMRVTPKYDFIFCRNLLIYFDRTTQRLALDKIERLLAPAGVLFVGAAELPLVLNRGFVPANLPQAFACVRAEETVIGSQARQPSAIHQAAQPPRPAPPTQPQPREETPIPSSKAASVPDTHAELDRAKALADAGDLQQAAAICEAHLRQHGPSAQAYYLLGLVRDAGGESSAIDYYRKALYLEPDHYETLAQMALWSQKEGDTARARTFRERARRVKSKLQPEAVGAATGGNR